MADQDIQASQGDGHGGHVPPAFTHRAASGPTSAQADGSSAATARVAELEQLLLRRTAERNAARQELDRQTIAAGQVPNADGNALSARLHVIVDELGRISEELEERNSALATANWRLEQRVAERTAALQAALEAKRESEARFHAVAESMPQLVWTSLPLGHWDFANRRWLAYTGQTRQQALGHGWLAAVHLEDRADTLAAWREAARTGGRLMVEHRIRSADGAWRWFESQALPIHGEHASETRWVGASTDVNARKLAEQAMRQANQALEQDLVLRRSELAESEARFRAYFQISTDALFVVACVPDGRCRHEALNQAFERLTGLWAEQAVGREARDFMPAAAAAVFEEHYQHCAATNAPHAFDALLALPSGDRMLRVSLVPTQASGAGGAATRCLLGSARDLGARPGLRSPPNLDA